MTPVELNPHATLLWERIIDCLEEEIVAARKKFPENRDLFLALGEEFGELAQALLERRPTRMTFHEAIQVAAVALRIAQEGVPESDFHPGYECYQYFRRDLPPTEGKPETPAEH